jgi:hypothetical protein
MSHHCGAERKQFTLAKLANHLVDTGYGPRTGYNAYNGFQYDWGFDDER